MTISLFVFSRYLLGFFLWNVDNLACESLRAFRGRPDVSPWAAAASQLHGWWHIFAGYATYVQIVSVVHHRRRYLRRPVCYTVGPVGLALKRDVGYKEA